MKKKHREEQTPAKEEPELNHEDEDELGLLMATWMGENDQEATDVANAVAMYTDNGSPCHNNRDEDSRRRPL